MSKIALSLDNKNRLTSACIVLPGGNYDDMPIVDTLPEGDILDYLYVNGEFIYDPIPVVEPEEIPS